MVTIFLFKFFFQKFLTFFVYYVHEGSEGVCRVFTCEGVCRYLLLRVYVGYLLVRVYVGYLLVFTFEGVCRVFTLRVYVGYLLVFTFQGVCSRDVKTPKFFGPARPVIQFLILGPFGPVWGPAKIC